MLESLGAGVKMAWFIIPPPADRAGEKINPVTTPPAVRSSVPVADGLIGLSTISSVGRAALPKFPSHSVIR